MSTRRERRQREAKAQEAIAVMSERIAELETALEDDGWISLQGAGTTTDFSREALNKINRMARVMYLKNPLIRRGVNVQAFYVFGQGLTVVAHDEDVNDVVQRFLDDSKNQAELTSHQARMAKERILQLEGNIFFCFFVNDKTGAVRIRSLPVAEVTEIIFNPEDRRDPWFYKRVWVEARLDASSGRQEQKTRTAYYPDWRHRPDEDDRPERIAGHPVLWDVPVYHVSTGAVDGMAFGVSEVYAAIDWARAYKDFLENWATIVKAHSRFAWKVSNISSPGALASIKQKFSASPDGSNPPPVVGSTLLERGEVKVDPVRTSGATTSADDGRRMALMAYMVFGLPETFFADASVGSLATARSLDRPTELQMKDRQTLWTDIYRNILAFVVEKAVEHRALPGRLHPDDDGTPIIDLGDRDERIVIEFPPILEHNANEAVAAVVHAATLGAAGTWAGTLGEEQTVRLLLSALGVEDIDEELKYRDESRAPTAAESKLLVAIKELKGALSFEDR